MDLALIAQAATLKSRVPFLHFFDGFRTSHEIRKIEELADDDIRAMIDDNLVLAHRQRALNPEHPVHPRHGPEPRRLLPGARGVQSVLPGRARHRPGGDGQVRRHRRPPVHLFDYVGAPDAERVIVMMGSGADIAHETVEHLTAPGEKVGLLKVRLYRPFSVEHLWPRCPATAKIVTALDRTQGAGRRGRAAVPGLSSPRSSRRAAASRCWAAAMAWRARNSPPRWSRACSTTWPPRRRRTTSPSASTTT